jgi:hypothetical protein
MNNFGVRQVAQKGAPEACCLIGPVEWFVEASDGALYAHPAVLARRFWAKKRAGQ